MDSEKIPSPFEDDRNAEQSRQSLRSTGKDSEASIRSRKQAKSREADEKESCAGDRARTQTRDPDSDRDQLSDGGGRRRSARSSYSEDDNHGSPSERSLSPYSRTPSPSPPHGIRARKASSSPLHKIALRRGMSRPQRVGAQAHQPRRGMRSQSKETVPPRDLDLVAKRMLSARLLKINELRNALAELQLRADELQKENRILRQLQVRQEKALQRYDDTESEISQLLSRHSSETRALRERLRRALERERAAERGHREVQEQLRRSQAALGRLRRLAEERELGPREELSRRLDQERARALENESKVKELERSMELSSSSQQRQLAAERKKSSAALEEVRVLRQEMESLSSKLKEKERELDARNIYANRILRPSPRRETDSTSKNKAPSRNSSKAVQTEDRKSSFDFPSPPPAITNGNEHGEQPPDDYLSLKELTEVKRRARAAEEKEREERQREQQRRSDREEEREREEENRRSTTTGRELNALEEKARRVRDGGEEEESRRRRSQKEDENRKRLALAQEEDERRTREALANQEAAEAERRRKDQLLAKLREIDQQQDVPAHGAVPESASPEPRSGPAAHSPPRFPELRRQSPTEEAGFLRGGADSKEGGWRGGGGGEGGALTAATGTGRRPVRAQTSGDDLAFGSYAPSFGRPAPRGSAFPPSTPKDERSYTQRGVADAVFRESERDSGTPGKEKKSNLMQQLFGPPSSSSSSALPVLPSPPSSTPTGRGRREGPFTFDPDTPVPLPGALHVAESRPSVRAVPSFDDDIEELTL